MRRLIHIPIIHTLADMGELGDSIRRVTIKKLGKSQWETNLRTISELWEGIREEILALNLVFPFVRLYQDGLPVCGRELDIATDLAKAGSQNHKLLLLLVERGAVLMGTESPELLLKEYNLIKQVLVCRADEEAVHLDEKQKRLSRLILQKRDRFIASRINGTLREGETGILFLGMLHCIEGMLDADIGVEHPIFRPEARSRPGSMRVEDKER